MDHQNQPRHPGSLLMVAHRWRARQASSTAGGNSSPTCSTDPRPLTKKPWTWSHKTLLWSTFAYPPLWMRSRNSRPDKFRQGSWHGGISADLFKSAGPETLRSFYDILISHKTSRMPQLSPCSRTRVAYLIVATEVSRSCPSLGRFLHESSSIA